MRYKRPEKFTEDPQYINGLTSVYVEVKEKIQPSQSSLVDLVSDKDAPAIELQYTSNFRPGSVVAFRWDSKLKKMKYFLLIITVIINIFCRNVVINRDWIILYMLIYCIFKTTNFITVIHADYHTLTGILLVEYYLVFSY